MRLTLIIPSLGAGGAERVMSTLANAWARDNAVTLITLTGSEVPDFYPLNAQVHRVRLTAAGATKHLGEAIAKNFHRCCELRQAIQRTHPNLVISFMESVNVLTLIAARARYPVIISERNHPLFHDCGSAWRFARRLAYPFCTALVVQTEAISRCFRSVGSQRRFVIPNPVPNRPRLEPPDDGNGGPLRIIAMGRLVTQKGFDLLLDAVACSTNDADVTLRIFGEGPDRKPLLERAASLGIADRVRIFAPVKDVTAAFAESDVFALSSRYEGFPNVLCEAMAAGLPAIAFDCPCGPAEIISDGIDGVLVRNGDVRAFADAIVRLARERAARTAMAERAREVSVRFSLDRVTSLWARAIAFATA